MSEFYKRFLMEDGRRLEARAGRYFALGVFGKHPGWDDHIEDLGLETESLNLAKRVLYVEGIGGQIDRGAWEELREEQRLNAFDHLFVWRRGEQFLAGRMWSSSDGKGRTRYPMILCAHGVGASLSWALDVVLPKLAEVQTACQAVRSAEEVRSIVGAAREALRAAIATGEAGAPSNLTPADVSRLLGLAELGPDREGLLRILYSLQTHGAAFAPGRFSLKNDPSGLRPIQLRTPLVAQSAAQLLPVWERLLEGYADRTVPRLFIWPTSGEWMDVTFGEPSPHEFFCIRAGAAAVPLTTQVPYDLDAAFREAAARQLADFSEGRPVKPAAAAPKPQPDRAAPEEGSSTTRSWLKALGDRFWLLIGVLALLCLLGAVIVVVTSRHPPPSEPSVEIAETAEVTPNRKSSQPPPASAGSTTVVARAPSAPPEAAPKTGGEPKQPVASESKATPPQPAEHAEAQKRAAEVEEAKRLAEDQIRREAAARLEAENKARKAAAEAEAARQAEAARLAEEKSRAEAAARVAVAVPSASVTPTATAVAAGSGREKPGDLTNGIGMVLLWVAGLPDAGKGAWVGKYEVTQAEYEQTVGANPSQFRAGRRPVDSVTWDQAMAFCAKLTAAEKGKGRLPSGFAYGLPTERQWEFLLGNATFEQTAVTSRQSRRAETAEVGSQPPNQYGLHDVLGNVWEWCADLGAGGQRILKGDAFNSKGLTPIAPFKQVLPTTAYMVAAGTQDKSVGFRCVLVAGP